MYCNAKVSDRSTKKQHSILVSDPVMDKLRRTSCRLRMPIGPCAAEDCVLLSDRIREAIGEDAEPDHAAYVEEFKAAIDVAKSALEKIKADEETAVKKIRSAIDKLPADVTLRWQKTK